MALITVGNDKNFDAWTDARAVNTTCAETSHPASGTGKITSIHFKARADGTYEFATFSKSGNNLTTIDSQTVAGLVAGALDVAVDLDINTGNFIGAYSLTGRVAYSAGEDGLHEKLGDYIPCVNEAFTSQFMGLAIRGTGTTIPTITSLTQDHGFVGDSVVIAGSNFDAAQGAGGVTVNGIAATVTAWATGSITITIPGGATTGPVVVTNNTGGVSAGVTWTLDPAPPVGGGGHTVRIGGFSAISAGAIVCNPPVQG